MNPDPLGKSPGQPSDLSSTGLTNDYTNIADVPIDALSDRVQPRQIPTGDTRGEQTIKGLIRVVDSTGEVRMIMGYKEGAF